MVRYSPRHPAPRKNLSLGGLCGTSTPACAVRVKIHPNANRVAQARGGGALGCGFCRFVFYFPILAIPAILAISSRPSRFIPRSKRLTQHIPIWRGFGWFCLSGFFPISVINVNQW